MPANVWHFHFKGNLLHFENTCVAARLVALLQEADHQCVGVSVHSWSHAVIRVKVTVSKPCISC